MEGFAVFATIAVIVGVVLCVFAVAHLRENRRKNLVWGRVAEDLHGELTPAKWITPPEIRFRRDDIYGKIDLHRTGKNNTTYTQMHLTWSENTFRMSVFPQRFFHRLGKLFMQDIQLGSQRFDSRFIIQGSDPEGIRHIMSPGAQQVIESLRGMVGNDDVFIHIQRGELVIRKLSGLYDYANLSYFAKLGFDLHDQFTAFSANGIQFMDGVTLSEPAFYTGQAMCQICGEEINQQAVWCRSCKTPHHKDCWQYYGACSVYGCGEKKFKNRRK